MSHEAQVAIRVVIPLEPDLPTVDLDSHLHENDQGRVAVKDPAAYERELEKVDKTRRRMAKATEKAVAGAVRDAIPKGWKLVDAQIEEVRER